MRRVHALVEFSDRLVKLEIDVGKEQPIEKGAVGFLPLFRALVQLMFSMEQSFLLCWLVISAPFLLRPVVL